jgi:hypothetical protein
MRYLFCGICKNIAPNVPIVKEWFSSVPASTLVVYENNSTDGTQELLTELASTPNVFVRSEVISEEENLRRCKAHTWDRKGCRIELIANARNALLQYIRELELANKITLREYDYIIMLDLDNPVPFPFHTFDPIVHKYHQQFDVLCCNGVAKGSDDMYDLYALRTPQDPFGPEYLGDVWWNMTKHAKVTSELMPVYSAFNGACVFSLSAFETLLQSSNPYSAFATKELHEWLLSNPQLVQQLVQYQSHRVQTHHEGALLGEYLFGYSSTTDLTNPTHPNIWYYHNSGYSFPVVCEHVIMFMYLRSHHFSRVFVARDWVWEWVR